MNLWFLICALSVIRPCMPVCNFCTPALTEFHEKLGCKTSCRRNECITGYDCRIPLSKRGKACFFGGQTYPIDAEVTVQVTPTEQRTYTCTEVGTSQIWFETSTDMVSGTVNAVDNLIIEFFSTSAMTGKIPAIRSDTNTFKFFKDADLPASTCAGGPHCCYLNGKSYEWNTAFKILNFNCSCMCSPCVTCVPV